MPETATLQGKGPQGAQEQLEMRYWTLMTSEVEDATFAYRAAKGLQDVMVDGEFVLILDPANPAVGGAMVSESEVSVLTKPAADLTTEEMREDPRYASAFEQEEQS